MCCTNISGFFHYKLITFLQFWQSKLSLDIAKYTLQITPTWDTPFLSLPGGLCPQSVFFSQQGGFDLRIEQRILNWSPESLDLSTKVPQFLEIILNVLCMWLLLRRVLSFPKKGWNFWNDCDCASLGSDVDHTSETFSLITVCACMNTCVCAHTHIHTFTLKTKHSSE
jgi:hypothetical protein